jgi:hypothetical protein
MIGSAGFCALYQRLNARRGDCSVATLAKTHSRTSNHELSEFSLGVSLMVFATSTALQISAVRDPRVSVQIGGGVRVSGAFQAMSSWRLIAI